MAVQSINTRIKNKVDNYSVWHNSTTPLLNGEIAIVRVPTGSSYTNPVTGKSEPVVELLMKVGDGTSAFDSLPWLSAKASDVYGWAKNAEAKDIPVAVIKAGATEATSNTLGAWLKEVYDKGTANASNIAINTNAISTLNGAATANGSIANKIKAAIEALDVSDTAVTGKFVTKVSETDGKISVARAAIAESDLPNISASKIKVDTSTTLDTKLGTVDSDIAALKARNNGHTDAEINALIDTKTNTLDFTAPTASGTATSFIDSVSQTNGVITATKKTIPSASASTAGITKLGATGGAATYDSIYGSDGKGGLNKTVGDLSSEVSSLKTSVAGGVHFVGTTTTALTDGATTSSITVDSKTHNPSKGDVVLYGEKEFIWTGSTWEELGDLTRVGTLETLTGSIHATSATSNQFVTHIAKENNKLVAKTARPTAADIKYGDSSDVATKISTIDAAIATKADGGHNHNNDYAAKSHAHGNIANDGTITSTAVTAATGVLVYDANSKIQRATAENVRAIIGAGTSSLTIGTTATTAAAGNHTHGTYESQIADINDKLTDVTSTVGTSISTAINGLTHATSGSGSYVTNVTQSAGKVTVTKGNLPEASTSAKGIVQLSDSTSSTSTTVAATANAVKSAYDKANGAVTDIATIKSDYVKVGSDNQLYKGNDVIIFDCGGAPA